MLKMDTPRRKTSFLKIASAVEDIAPFQIEELNFYYEKYFPDARTDSVLDFIIQLNIGENDWVSAERNILKFLYLFPESPLYEEIKTVRSLIFQNEKYFKPYSNILGELVSNAPLLPRPDVRYFRYVEVLKDLPDLSVRNAFIPEARRFLALYPDSKYAPDASLWIAKSLLNNNQPHSAFLFYQKIMILYPESAYYIGALHASGVIQQEQFTEFTNAVATFSDLIKRFPNDSLAENSQFRIAKIYDENLNNWEQASQEYQIFANRHPQSPQAVPALMRKAALQAEKMNMIEEASAPISRSMNAIQIPPMLRKLWRLPLNYISIKPATNRPLKYL
jgi:TolA-binding protein